jgi:hypothetical protein
MTEPTQSAAFIADDWLKSVGFKWDTPDRNHPENKHWTLWFGDLDRAMFSSFEDVGIEVCYGAYNELSKERDCWFCWLRSDCAHRYSRFLHIRHIRFQHELVSMITGLTGLPWKPENHLYGCIRRDEDAERIRRSEQRLDIRCIKGEPWKGDITDETQAPPRTNPNA